VDQADQSILNMLFENKWRELDFDNNHIVIHERFANYSFPDGQEYPGIIHYLSERKPWHTHASQTYRDVWWYYHDMEWTELGKNHHLHPLQKSHLYPIKEPFTCLIYTASDHIEQIETLVQSLPDIQFKIAARVMVSDRLAQMTVYPNVTIFNGIHYLVDVDNELVETSQVLLDINHGEKTEEMLDQFSERGKLILAFENTKYFGYMFFVEYDGQKFESFDENPNKKSVKAEFRKILESSKIKIFKGIQQAGRTDANVSAKENILYINSKEIIDFSKLKFLEIEGLKINKIVRTLPFLEFPQMIQKRYYIYEYPENLVKNNEERISQICEKVSGKRDFYEFTSEKGKKLKNHTREIFVKYENGKLTLKEKF